MEHMIEGIAIGLAVTALAATFKHFAPRVTLRWSRWRNSRAAAALTRKTARDHERRRRERKDRIAAAVAEGKVVAIARSGHRPVEVTFSDGNRAHFFCGDMEAYRQAMNSGHYDLRRTHHGNPPEII